MENGIKKFCTKEELIGSLTDFEKKQLDSNDDWTSKDWSEFSLQPHTEDEIRKRILIDALTGKHSICLLYIFEGESKFSPEFIDEVSYLTSSIFDFDHYNQECIDIFNAIYDLKSNTERYEYIKNILISREEFIKVVKDFKDVSDNIYYLKNKLTNLYKVFSKLTLAKEILDNNKVLDVRKYKGINKLNIDSEIKENALEINKISLEVDKIKVEHEKLNKIVINGIDTFGYKLLTEIILAKKTFTIDRIDWKSLLIFHKELPKEFFDRHIERINPFQLYRKEYDIRFLGAYAD